MSNEHTNEQFYQITPSADGCNHCGAGQYWTICHKDPTGEFIEIGTSWKGEEGKETAQDVCDLMNMAYDAGLENRCVEIEKYKAWAASCDPSPAVQAAVAELAALQTECSAARWVRDHCLGLLRGQLDPLAALETKDGR